MALLGFLYVMAGVIYALCSMYRFTHSGNQFEDEVMAEILRQHFRLRLELFLFFTFGWLPYHILRSTET